MKDQFRSDLRVGKVTAPVLVVHGENDTVVPMTFGKRLYGLIRAPKRFVSIAAPAITISALVQWRRRNSSSPNNDFSWKRALTDRRRSSYAGNVMRMTIAAVLVATLTVSGSAQDFMADPGAPAAVFPKPDRPVANIVSPIWHDEKERDAAGEPSQLVRLLGIKSGMTVADIGAGSGYYVVRLSPIVGPAAALSQKMSCPNIYGSCVGGCVISDCRTSPSAPVSRTIRGCQQIRSTLRSWCTCITRSHSLTPCSTISSLRSSLARASALSTRSRRRPSMVRRQVSCAVSLQP